MTKKQAKGKSGKKSFDWYTYAPWILVLLCFLTYLPVLNLGLTQLDDTIFIKDKEYFISKFENIGKAFTIGTFNEKDIYYRPVLLVYFILLYPFSSASSVAIYHFGNLGFHMLNVWLLFKLLNSLTGKKGTSLWLAAFFAVHPALTMAVAWVPGINDLLLTTFALGYFLTLLKIADHGTPKVLVLNTIFLSFALFTKETAAFIPAGGILLLWYKGYLPGPVKKFGALIICNGLSWIAWFMARRNVLPEDAPALINTDMAALVFHRLQGVVQYFGKCILPFNLTVFPTIEDTTIIWGIAAVVLIIVLIFMNRDRNVKAVSIGLLWFVLFLLPIFFVPKNVNDQLFEHRLYLPMIGILLILQQTVLFSAALKTSVRQIVVIAIGFTWITMIRLYLPEFNDTFSFWNNAVAASPHNAYANKLLGIKLSESNRGQEALPYIQKAYELDTNERYTRLFLARLIFLPLQQWDSARYYLQREIDINPQFSDTYAELARVCVEQKDFTAAEKYILKYLELKPMDLMLNSNLLLIYKDQGNYSRAKEHAELMKSKGLEVNESLYKLFVDSTRVSP